MAARNQEGFPFVSLTRTHNLAGLEVTIEAGHRAWSAYEEKTGRSVLLATQLRELFTGGATRIYEWGWALSAKWRAQHAPTMLYEAWLDILPELGSESWNEFHAKVSDLVTLFFYSKTWAELVDLLKEQERLAEEEAQKVVEAPAG